LGNSDADTSIYSLLNSDTNYKIGAEMVKSSAKMKKMKSAIWISYDLGVRGDYEALYTWLDEHEAQECGDSLAFLNYEYTGSLKDSVTKELGKALEITKQTRIYLVYRERETNKIRGSFIFGGRKAAPWSGYGRHGQADVDES
jgi:hypothetical protein